MPTLWSALESWWSERRSRIREGRAEYEISDELRFHFEQLINYHIEQGLTPDEAREAAQLRFGDLRKLKNQCRAIYPKRKGQMMDALFQDLRYGARLLLKHRTFTIVAVLSLAIGIGVNTAMFSFVDAVLLKPLAYQQPESLVVVSESLPASSGESMPSPPTFFHWREQNQVFTQMAAYTESGGDLNMAVGNSSERVLAASVSANYFDLVGIQPVMGRGFREGEDQMGNQHVAILTNKLWQRRFGSDPNISGKKITLNEEPYTIVGVLPANGIFDRKEIDLWLPLAVPPDRMRYNTQFFSVMARLKPGITTKQAADQMQSINHGLDIQGRPKKDGWMVLVKPLRDDLVRKDQRTTLLLLMGAVMFILLIACANVANLLLARSASRRREVAIRAALGAGRLRLLRQFLAESILLSMMGGFVGLILAFWLIKGLTALMPVDTIPVEAQVGLDYRILIFAIGLSVFTGVLSGLLPAFQTANINLASRLQERDLSVSPKFSRNKSRSLLLVSEIALSFILVMGAALLIRSFSALISVDPGFRADKILTLKTDLSKQHFPLPQQMIAYETELLRRIEALPAVRAAAITNSLPLDQLGTGTDFNPVRQQPNVPKRANARIRAVTPGYFNAIGMRLLKGRLLSEYDTQQSDHSIVVNQTLAQKIWDDRDPIGEQVIFESKTPFTIVGVVADVKHKSLDAAPPLEIYVPLMQLSEDGVGAYGSRPKFVIRSDRDPMNLAAAIQSVASGLDKGQPLYDIRTMDKIVSNSVAEPKFRTLLFSVFGSLALLLAAVGIYGVMAYSVTQRVKEIGIRMALGAQRRDIFQLLIGRGLLITLIGIGLGVAGAIAFTRFLTTLLFEIKGTDPLTFVSVAAIMISVAILACYFPARRATKVDPMVTLRYE